MSLPFLASAPVWQPPKFSELPSWADAKRVAVDIETCDPQLKELGPGVRRDGFIAGVSFAIEDGPSFYLPTRHQGGGNMPEEGVFDYLREQIKNFSGTIVGANLPYDLDYLMEYGCDFSQTEWFRDVQIAEPLLNELQFSYSLDNIARYNGMPGKDEDELKFWAARFGYDAKSEMYRLPAGYVAKYAIRDVTLPLQLLRRQERKIEHQDIQDIYDLESKVLPVLVKMRRRGVAVDPGKLGNVEDFCHQKITAALSRVKEISGVTLLPEELDTAEAVAGPLLAQGLDLGLTDGRLCKKTGKRVGKQPRTDKATLSGLGDPTADAIMEAKKYNKIIGTFVSSIRTHMVNGRIHCTFKQLKGESDFAGGDEKGAKFGRLSCIAPNMQQQPSRGEIGKLWRSIYVPDGDGVWTCCDFSSQEPRIAAHYAVVAKCQGGKVLRDAFWDDPRLDFHAKMAELIGNPCPKGGHSCGIDDCNCNGSGFDRKNAKAIFLGLAYGMGPGKLCRELGLPTKWIFSKRLQRDIEVADVEGAAILEKFDEMVPWVRQLALKCKNKAKRVGFIKTIGGRHCRFPQNSVGQYDFLHKALNRLIQGSAADQGKAALVALDAAGIPLQLQVHDEFDFTAESHEQAREAAQIMVDACQMEVPMVVDVECGPSWGEVETISA